MKILTAEEYDVVKTLWRDRMVCIFKTRGAYLSHVSRHIIRGENEKAIGFSFELDKYIYTRIDLNTDEERPYGNNYRDNAYFCEQI